MSAAGGPSHGRVLSVLPTLLPGFAGTTLPAWLAARLRSGLGGVCLFARNIESFPQLRLLTDAVHAANPAALVALDEEGGDVTRLFADTGSPYPGNAVLGRIDDPNATRAVAAEVGWQLRPVGCNVDFAPCLDVNTNPDNPVIGVRSFGATADLAARHGAAWVAGLQATGVAASAKHFPGHGDTSQDSHRALPVIDRSLAQLRQRELVPFAAAIDAGARLIMTSHLLLPAVDDENPATMSHRLLSGLLRTDLGFPGVIVSDALDMAGAASAGGVGEAAVRALAAGCDLLCLGNNTTEADLGAIERAAAEAVADRRLELRRLSEAADRVRALGADLATSAASPPSPGGGWPRSHRDLIAAFDIAPAAAAWRTATAGRFSVVRLETEAN
ncbi:MAG: beta-N-acetylhexosaminidase, partial [Actinomycetes bacterium]